MEERKDILEGMKNAGMPFTTPEGYFEGMRDRMEVLRNQDRPVSAGRRLAPYMAFAASLLLIATGGTFLLRNITPDTPDNDSLISSTTGPDVTEDDVLAYMIYSGAEIEDFADLLNE